MSKSRPKVFYPSYACLILLFAGVSLLQIVPFPELFIKIISPNTFLLYQQYLPKSEAINFYSIALYAFPVKMEIVKMVCYSTIFLITLNLFNSKKQLKRAFLMVILWGLFLCFCGIMKKYFIIDKETLNSFGTFGNRNHFSGYMLMIAPLAIGYALHCRNKAKKIIFSFIASLICASIFLSLSRGGTISLVLSLLLMGLFFKDKRFNKERSIVLSVVLVLGIFFVLIAGINPAIEKFSLLGQGARGRLEIVKDSIEMFRSFPIFGVGNGNFSYIFPIYKKFVSSAHYFYAHNDYLQLILENGLLGVFFYLGFFCFVLKEIITKLAARNDPFVKNMVSGGLCGLFGVMIHSVFEFNFHIPAISFLFLFVLALIYKCVNTHFDPVKNNLESR
ncbi:MAG: O-antigen ligase family protein [Candidatus Omnitrophota bacterium]